MRQHPGASTFALPVQLALAISYLCTYIYYQRAQGAADMPADSY